MPELHGYVSLWAGNCASYGVLDEYLSFGFDEDGDAILSPFADAFGLDWFDEDCREAHVHDAPCHSPHELLSGCSCESIILPRFLSAFGMPLPSNTNAAVLLYDFIYDGTVNNRTSNGVSLNYIGGVGYA